LYEWKKSSYLGICEEELGSAKETEYTKDDEEAPFDIEKCWRDEETNGEVEEPVA
jgi:hypothetical protein